MSSPESTTGPALPSEADGVSAEQRPDPGDPSGGAQPDRKPEAGPLREESGSSAFYSDFDAPGLTEEERARLMGGALVAPADHGPSSSSPSEAAAVGGVRPSATSLRPSEGAQAPQRPSFLFFGVVAAVSLVSDIGTKVWAEMTLNARGFEPLELVFNHVSITLAYNRGGAWGLFSTADEMIRKPFFLAVSAAAIAFIISLYSKLQAQQRALAWGLPLVLGGALGNLSDRITRSQVIDFIDYRADWVMSLNSFVQRYVPSWTVTDHWPTFNVADIAICIGVGLMAVDMFTHRPRRRAGISRLPSAPSQAPPAVG